MMAPASSIAATPATAAGTGSVVAAAPRVVATACRRRLTPTPASWPGNDDAGRMAEFYANAGDAALAQRRRARRRRQLQQGP